MAILSKSEANGPRWCGWALRVGVSLVMLAAAAFLLDWRQIAESLSKLSWGALAAAAALNILLQAILAFRWYLLVRHHVPGRAAWHLRHYWMATYFNLFTPAAIGADVYRVVALRLQEGDAGRLAGLVLKERFLGLLGYLTFYVVCVVLAETANGPDQSLPEAFRLAGIGATATAVAVALAPAAVRLGLSLFARRLSEIWSDRLRMVGSTLRYTSLREFLLLFAATVLACVAWAATILILALDTGTDISFPQIGMISALAEIIRWLPVSIQGIGVREAVFAFGFSQLGLDATTGFLLGALAYIINSLVLLLGGLLAASLAAESPTERKR